MAISTVIPTTFDKPGEIRVPHYVPGRKLTSEDLQDERNAALQHLQFIGRAAGKGIIEGLWVEALGKNQLTISAGLGINGVGHPISLANAAVLNVVLKTPSVAPQNNLVFGPCSPLMTINTNGLKDGAYLLTAVPVYELSKDMTPVQKVLPRGTQEDCTNKWEVEGISFRAVYLGQPDIPQGYADEVIAIPENATDEIIKLIQTKIRSRRQNRLAHWVYGTDKLLTQIRDPFQKWDDLYYSGFGVSRLKFQAENDLTDCDLYLAVFYLETDGQNGQSIQFVDNWAVRRRLSQAFQFPLIAQNGGTAGFTGWSQRLNDQLAAEGEARFAQFQEQFDTLRQQPNMVNWTANRYFRYLPSAGYVPLLASEKLIKAISKYMIDLLQDEIQKSSTNPQNSQLKIGQSTITPLAERPEILGFPQLSFDHVTQNEVNRVISSFNTIFETMTNVTNKLAGISSQKPIVLQTISLEPVSNDHIMLNSYNNRILGGMNNWFTDLKNLINQLGIPFGISVTDPSLESLIGADDNRDHINNRVFNEKVVRPLNTKINNLVNALNGIIDGGSNAWNAVNTNFDRIRTELNSKLQDELPKGFTTMPNAVTLENFFALDADTSYIENLAFTDRQTIETILENSWRAPAIDLSKKQNLSFIMVYEDIIPTAFAQLKSIIETIQFSNRDSLYKIWLVDIASIFNRIITYSSRNKPLLYGLFTQAVYPLQTAIWQQETVVINEPQPEINQQPAGEDEAVNPVIIAK